MNVLSERENEENIMTVMTERIPWELRSFCPQTSEELLTCPSCNAPATRWRVDKKFEWARVLYCKCKKDWVVCACCPKSAVRMINQKTIYSHNRNCHSACKKRKLAKQEQEDGDGNTMFMDAVSVVDEGVEEKWMEARFSPQRQDHSHCLLHTGHAIDEAKSAMGSVEPGRCQVRRKSMRDFGNLHSTSYFNADISGSGVADVVALSQFGISSLGNNLHPADVQYVTDMANFVHGLTQMQRNDLSRLLHGTVSKLKRDFDAGNKCKWKTIIPTDPVDMRRQVLGWQKFVSREYSLPDRTRYP